MYMRALQGREEAYGAMGISTLMTVNNLGDLYRQQGKLAESEQMLLRALQGFEETYGDELVETHVEALKVMGNLGSLYTDQGKLYDDQSKLLEAEKMLLQALQGCKEAFGDELVKTHVIALDTMRNLGDLYLETRPDES